MTLDLLPDGSHLFRPPERPYVGQSDPLGRTAQIGSPSTRPVGGANFTPPTPVKGHKMDGYEVVSFQLEIYDIRGTWMQDGPIDMAHCNFAECEFVGDGPYVARHPFPIKADAGVAGEWTTSYLSRMPWALFKNSLFATMGLSKVPPVIYAEISQTNPVLAKVASFAPSANAGLITCMAPVTCAGVTYLFVGYSGGASLGCDAFIGSTLTPAIPVDTSDGHLGTNSGVAGIIQAPDGSVLIATIGGDLRIADDNTVAPAALSFQNAQTQALGFYPVAVGNCALSNYSPGALWWSPIEAGDGLYFANNNLGATDATPRGRLILSTYDGLQLDPIDFPDLPWVSFATIFRGGVCACDRRAHYWYTGRRMIPMDGNVDRETYFGSSHKHRLCCGHAVVNDKLLILEAESDDRFSAAAPDAVDADGNNYHTTAQFLEFDPYREQLRPISKKFDLSYGGQSVLVGAMPSLPFGPDTRNVHAFSIYDGLTSPANGNPGQWLRQYQPRPNATGWAERSTDQAAAGAHEFTDTATYRSPLFVHPALRGWEYTPVRLTGPRKESLLQGGSNAYISINCGGYDDSAAAPQKLRADGPDNYPSVNFGDWRSQRTWSSALQIEATSHQATGAIHLTTNLLPLTLEVIARRALPKAVKI